jgi:hypothetical protein
MLVAGFGFEDLGGEALNVAQESSINYGHRRHNSDSRLYDFLWNPKSGAHGACCGMEAAGVRVYASVDIKGARAAVFNENALAGLDLLIDKQHGVLYKVVALQNFFKALKLL